ncbi:MAG TPA: hypothetical protein DCY13_15330 [Verrucomicrobiales bacterium]|nr:hypothetical protein [Verrucomicrobiales bacterium]
MKRIIKTMKNLGAKAEHWREVVEAAPQRAEQLKQALLQTAGQFQQLRTDVQEGFHDLKADDDKRLMSSLAEVHEHRAVLAEAGFDLTGVDLELGIARRVIVHLEQIEVVPAPLISSLRARHNGHRTLQAILGGLIQAVELSTKVRLDDLPRLVVTVQLGATPGIRAGWRPVLGIETDEPASAAHDNTAPSAAPTTASAGKPPPLPDASPEGFFARREPLVVNKPDEEKPVTTTPLPQSTNVDAPTPNPVPASSGIRLTPRPSHAPAVEPGPAATSEDWRKSALDRFKRMPKL